MANPNQLSDWRQTVKKSIKKLALNKETLRNLNEDQLNEAAGGKKSDVYSECINKSCGIACTVECHP
jgi:hypothetical protein